jgi:hypothetical protein
MTTEFSKNQKNKETVYTLESTTSAAVASVPMPMGGTRKQGLLAQEADKTPVVPSSKPRNFVAKNATTGGAGAHVDKKRAQKQGKEKHKKPFAESADEYTVEKQIKTRIHQIIYDRKLSGTDSNAGELNQLKARLKGLRGQKDVAEGSNSSPFNQEQNLRNKSNKELADIIQLWNRALEKNPEDKIAREQLGLIKMIRSERIGKKNMSEDHEIQMASSELQSIAKNAVNLLDLVRRYSEREGLQAWQQSKITRAADYLNSVLQSISGEQHDTGMAENFQDGKNTGRKGLAKRSGVNTGASVSSLRDTAKHSTGEKQRMAHWLANMKSGRAKDEGVEEVRVAQLPTRGADYSKYDTDHLKMMLRPGILHRDEARFKALIRKELQKREQQSQQGMAEGSKKNVVKSVKVGNFRHDLVDTGFGWQVRIYNGDELYDTGLSKNSEQKGLNALDSSVAYTKKQLNIKEQGVAEVAGAQKCWPGYKKTGTQPGTGKNAGKRVNDCEKIKEDDIDEAAKHGLYYNVNKRKAAGTSRPASSPKAPTAQAWKDAAKTAKKESVAESEGRCMQCGMKDCKCPGTSCKCKPIAGWIPGKGFKKAMDEAALNEKWTQKYKSSINCSHPKGFSQKAHCAGKKKHNEDLMMEMTCPDCGMCETHGNHMMEIKQRLDAKCWKGKHKEGTKIKGGVRVNNCVPNESHDAYSQRLQATLESALAEKIPANAPVDVWVQDFQTANPEKYHQFKNKAPEKKAQMAVAASYAAKNPSKKK